MSKILVCRSVDTSEIPQARGTEIMKKGIVQKALSIIGFILLLLYLWLEIDWLLILTAVLTAICIVLSFSMQRENM